MVRDYITQMKEKMRHKCYFPHISPSAREYNGKKLHTLRKGEGNNNKIYIEQPNLAYFSKILFLINRHVLDFSGLLTYNHIIPGRP